MDLDPLNTLKHSNMNNIYGTYLNFIDITIKRFGSSFKKADIIRSITIYYQLFHEYFFDNITISLDQELFSSVHNLKLGNIIYSFIPFSELGLPGKILNFFKQFNMTVGANSENYQKLFIEKIINNNIDLFFNILDITTTNKSSITTNLIKYFRKYPNRLNKLIINNVNTCIDEIITLNTGTLKEIKLIFNENIYQEKDFKKLLLLVNLNDPKLCRNLKYLEFKSISIKLLYQLNLDCLEGLGYLIVKQNKAEELINILSKKFKTLKSLKLIFPFYLNEEMTSQIFNGLSNFSIESLVIINLDDSGEILKHAKKTKQLSNLEIYFDEYEINLPRINDNNIFDYQIKDDNDECTYCEAIIIPEVFRSQINIFINYQDCYEMLIHLLNNSKKEYFTLFVKEIGILSDFCNYLYNSSNIQNNILDRIKNIVIRNKKFCNVCQVFEHFGLKEFKINHLYALKCDIFDRDDNPLVKSINKIDRLICDKVRIDDCRGKQIKVLEANQAGLNEFKNILNNHLDFINIFTVKFAQCDYYIEELSLEDIDKLILLKNLNAVLFYENESLDNQKKINLLKQNLGLRIYRQNKISIVVNSKIKEL